MGPSTGPPTGPPFDGSFCALADAHHPKETLAAWSKKHVKDGLSGVYQRGVKYMYDEKRSYMPQWVAAPAVDLFDAVWKEIQEPVGEYLEEEFDRAIGVLHGAPRRLVVVQVVRVHQPVEHLARHALVRPLRFRRRAGEEPLHHLAVEDVRERPVA